MPHVKGYVVLHCNLGRLLNSGTLPCIQIDCLDGVCIDKVSILYELVEWHCLKHFVALIIYCRYFDIVGVFDLVEVVVRMVEPNSSVFSVRHGLFQVFSDCFM